MPSERWVAIDFETASREATSACALGIAVIEGGRIVDSDSWLIRPPFNEYEYRNTLIHGLGPADTEFAPEFEEVWLDLQPVIDGARLLAHNAAFDMRVLRALVATRELPVVAPIEYACTVSLARKALPHLPRHTLDTVCDHCEIALVHHEASSDARACAEVALRCAEEIGAPGIAAAIEALGVNVHRL